MVRPILSVVTILADVIDFVLGFNIAMLGDSEVDADFRTVDRFEIYPGIGNSFLRTVNGNGPDSGAATAFFFLLIFQLIKITDSGMHLSHIPCFEVLHS